VLGGSRKRHAVCCRGHRVLLGMDALAKKRLTEPPEGLSVNDSLA
jgi:hypothetical protein